MTSSQLTFDVAYAPYDATFFDGLEVLVSTNCGASFTTVYSKSNTVLATRSATTAAFTPSGSSQWRTETIDLTPYIGQNAVEVVFKNLAGNGNNLYIDNINITGVTGTVSPPVAGFTSSSNSICAGQTITYTNTSTGTSNTYSWSFPGGSPSTSTSANPVVTYAAAGTFSVSLTATNTAGNNTTTQNNSITVNPKPTVTFGALNTVCSSTSPFVLTQGSPAGGSYTGNGVSSGQFNPATAGVGTTTLTYNYTNGNGCSNSATSSIQVNNCLGIDENTVSSVSIYPNPSSGQFTITNDGQNIESFGVYNQLGQLIYSQSVDAEKVNVDLLHVANGLYTIRVQVEVFV
jgi:PKD repeat protein